MFVVVLVNLVIRGKIWTAAATLDGHGSGADVGRWAWSLPLQLEKPQSEGPEGISVMADFDSF